MVLCNNHISQETHGIYTSTIHILANTADSKTLTSFAQNL